MGSPETGGRLGSGEMELEEYARIADAEQRHWWYRSMPALARAVLGSALRPGLRILDAGCGPGPNFEWLRPYGEVVGVDHSAEAIRLANARHPGTDAIQGDITALPFEHDSFDLALEFTVLALVEDDQRAVDEFARVIRPGGSVMLMEPAIPRLRRDHDEVNGVRRRYRLDDMRAMAARAGLTVARATHANSFLVPPAAALAVAHRLKRAGGDSASDFERDRLGPLFAAMAAGERRMLARRDIPFGLNGIVIASKP
jgi:ubiquinone/menaquinone biosynthesis C-methylase UbiE